jgi:flagellar protein FlbD
LDCSYQEIAVAMITLTRLGGEQFILNADLIQYIESLPDTFVTLTTGQRVVVAESMNEVVRRTVTYQQSKHLIPPLNGDRACTTTVTHTG